MEKSIAIIGQGFVGGSLTTVMAERGLKVYAYDKAGKYADGSYKNLDGGFARPLSISTLHEQAKGVESSLVHLAENDPNFTGIYFICLPTPMNEDGSADLSIVEGALTELTMKHGNRIAVIKSTVPPGSTERWNKMFEGTGLRVVFNPEFLREASALDDMRNQNRIILGGPRPYINTVKRMYEAVFPNVPIIKTSSTTAEMVKYVTNIHLAVKVSLANEFYQICEALDKKGANIDYDKVIEYASYDDRLGKSHWKVPGPMPLDDGSNKPAFGFGGSCFCKDINALIAQADSLGIDTKVMKAAWAKNLEVRPGRDWEKLLGRAVSKK